MTQSDGQNSGLADGQGNGQDNGQDRGQGGMHAAAARGAVLRRLARASPAATAADDPATLSPMRALRLALTRAAQRRSRLVITVLGITQEVVPLADLLRLIEADLLLIGLDGDCGLAGLAGIDTQTRAAVIEMQTMGKLRSEAAAARPVTATDLALVLPLLTGFLEELAQTSVATPLAGWVDGYLPGRRLPDLRAAGLALPESRYRLVRLTLDLGAGERQGSIVLALPESRTVADTPAPDPAQDWTRAFQTALGAAPADLHAVLHRMRLPLRSIEAFSVGQVLALPGVAVTSVSIEGPDGRRIAQARLGQLAGLRAVRLERPPPAVLSPAPPLPPVRRDLLGATPEPNRAG